MTSQTALTILLIDDEPGFVSALAQLLRHDGSTVDTAANGHAALTHLQAHHYDVVLCDLRMPGLDGAEFYTILRQQHAYLRHRVLFLTGDTLGADSTAFLEQWAVYLHPADKYSRLIRRVSSEQKGLDERALMASQRPSPPW
jgi:CheY-like chemotaxis protein